MKLTKNSVTILIEILFPLFTSEFRNVFLWVRFSGQFYSLLKVKLLFTCRDFFMIFIYPFKGSSNKIAARNPQQTVMISNDYSVIIPGIMMINFSKWEKKVFLINHYELFDNVLVRMVVEEKVWLIHYESYFMSWYKITGMNRSVRFYRLSGSAGHFEFRNKLGPWPY